MTEAQSSKEWDDSSRWTLIGEPARNIYDGNPVYIRTNPEGMLQVEFFHGVFKHYSVDQVTLLGDGDYDTGAALIGQQYVLNGTGAVNAPLLELRRVIESFSD